MTIEFEIGKAGIRLLKMLSKGPVHVTSLPDVFFKTATSVLRRHGIVILNHRGFLELMIDSDKLKIESDRIRDWTDKKTGQVTRQQIFKMVYEEEPTNTASAVAALLS